MLADASSEEVLPGLECFCPNTYKEALTPTPLRLVSLSLLGFANILAISASSSSNAIGSAQDSDGEDIAEASITSWLITEIPPRPLTRLPSRSARPIPGGRTLSSTT